MKSLMLFVSLMMLPALVSGQARKKPAAPVDKAAPAQPAPASPAAAPAPAPLNQVPAAQPAAAPADTAPANPSAILDSKEAEENAANQEAGAYERKSISYLNALWLMDKTLAGLKPEHVSYVLDEVKKKIEMPRFDYNPLPEKLIADFVQQANALNDITIDKLADLMNQTIVPKVLEVVNLNKEMRAANLTTEQQRNSFYSDKAKELGYTDVEIAKVMNSAYIYLPVAGKYAVLEGKANRITTSMQVGIIWFRISTKGDAPKATLLVKKMSTSLGFARKGKSYVGKDGLIGAEVFSFRSMVKNSTRNLLVASQAIPEFRLSSQVIEVDGKKVGFPLGKNEGLHVDDKFRIVEFEEKPDGSITQANNGWVLVNMVADSNSKEGYKSKALTVAGDPMQGVVLSEFPRIPIDILVKYKAFPYTNTDKNSSDTSSLGSSAYGIRDLEVNGSWLGLEVDALYNIGRHFGVNQLFFDFGFGFGAGTASGKSIRYDYDVFSGWTIKETEIKSVSNSSFEFSLLKKFYLGRWAVMIQPLFGSQTVVVNGGKIDVFFESMDLRWVNYGAGFAVNAGAEYALSPSTNFGIGAGYYLYGKNSDWSLEGMASSSDKWGEIYQEKSVELDHSGLSIQFYLTYSPPALPFDPIDFVRGMM